jgi:hypothetical protein
LRRKTSSLKKKSLEAELAKRNEIFEGELQAIKKDLLQRAVDLEEENIVVKEENMQIVEEVKRLQAQLEGPANISECEARGSLRTILKFESPGLSVFGQTSEVANRNSRAYSYSPGCASAPGGPERQSLETRFAAEMRLVLSMTGRRLL